MKRILAILGLALAAFSCMPTIENDAPVKITVPAEGGESVIEYRAESSWAVVSDLDWVEMSPLYGNSSLARITLKVAQNVNPMERTGDFRIVDGSKNVVFTIVQEASKGIITDADTYKLPMSAGEFTIPVTTNATFEASVDASWITLPSKYEINEGETTTCNVVLKFDESTASMPREATLTLKSAHSQKQIKLVQWNTYFKSTLGIRFTGTWCGWCPSLAYDVTQMDSKQPGRLICICSYNSSPGVVSAEESTLLSAYSISGFPSIALDDRYFFSNLGVGTNYKAMSDFVKEMKESYSPACGLALDVTMEGNTVNIHTKVSADKKAQYNLHLVLVESGIVASQEDYAGIYSSSELRSFVHNNVIKGFVTPATKGEAFSAEEFSVNEFNHSYQIPSIVGKKENLSVVAYVTRSTIKGPANLKYGGRYLKRDKFIDNAVICPVNSSVDYKYE